MPLSSVAFARLAAEGFCVGLRTWRALRFESGGLQRFSKIERRELREPRAALDRVQQLYARLVRNTNRKRVRAKFLFASLAPPFFRILRFVYGKPSDVVETSDEASLLVDDERDIAESAELERSPFTPSVSARSIFKTLPAGATKSEQQQPATARKAAENVRV